jgi:hypothetical protein
LEDGRIDDLDIHEMTAGFRDKEKKLSDSSSLHASDHPTDQFAARISV